MLAVISIIVIFIVLFKDYKEANKYMEEFEDVKKNDNNRQ